jgi:predicted ABC-type ATPase
VPDAVLIAGANGAGKTTFARSLVPAVYPEARFLNVDEIQRLDARFAHPLAAGREMLRSLAAAEADGASFALETTLSSNMYVRRIAEWRSAGYVVSLHFIELPSEQHAVDRVAARARAGGHDVPEADVRRRFQRGLSLFESVYKFRVDRWYHYRSDAGGLRHVDSGRNTADA